MMTARSPKRGKVITGFFDKEHVMVKKVMICGVDCHTGDANCNGYCTGKAEHPPEATPEQVVNAARAAAHLAVSAAEKAWYEYAGMCEVGPERCRAFDIYENIRVARRV